MGVGKWRKRQKKYEAKSRVFGKKDCRMDESKQ